MNTYGASDGKRYTQRQIEIRIRKAKQEKKEQFMDEHGFFFCEDCGRSSGRLDMSHTIGVYESKKQGKVELAWNVENIKIRCRACHQKHDKSY